MVRDAVIVGEKRVIVRMSIFPELMQKSKKDLNETRGGWFLSKVWEPGRRVPQCLLRPRKSSTEAGPGEPPASGCWALPSGPGRSVCLELSCCSGSGAVGPEPSVFWADVGPSSTSSGASPSCLGGVSPAGGSPAPTLGWLGCLPARVLSSLASRVVFPPGDVQVPSRLAGFWSSPSFFLAFGSAKPRGLGGIEPGAPPRRLAPYNTAVPTEKGTLSSSATNFQKADSWELRQEGKWDCIFMVSCIYIKMSWPFTGESPRVVSLGCGGEAAVEGTHGFSLSIHVGDYQVRPKLKSQCSGYPYGKEWKWISITHHLKNQFQVEQINMKDKSIHCLDDYIGKYLCRPRTGTDLL